MDASSTFGKSYKLCGINYLPAAKGGWPRNTRKGTNNTER